MSVQASTSPAEYDDAPDDSVAAPAGHAAQSQGGGIDATLLFFLGFCMSAGGTALAAAPAYSWKVQKIGFILSDLGISFGTLVVGGMVLVGLGMVSRAVHAARNATAEHGDVDVDLGLIADQIAADMGGVQASLANLALRMETVVEEQQRAAQALQADSSASGGGQENAIFRLAASVDQLSARVEGQVERQMESLGAVLQTLGERISGLESLLSQPPTTPGAPLAIEKAQSPVAQEEPAGAEQDQLEILVDLEEEFDEQPVLDFFDHLEDPAEAEQAPVAEAAPPAPALPAGETEKPSDPPASWKRSIDNLLPDDSVRKALDQGRAGGE